MDGKDLIKRVKEDEVKFISLQFTDVTRHGEKRGYAD